MLRGSSASTAAAASSSWTLPSGLLRHGIVVVGASVLRLSSSPAWGEGIILILIVIRRWGIILGLLGFRTNPSRLFRGCMDIVFTALWRFVAKEERDKKKKR